MTSLYPHCSYTVNETDQMLLHHCTVFISYFFVFTFIFPCSLSTSWSPIRMTLIKHRAAKLRRPNATCSSSTRTSTRHQRGVVHTALTSTTSRPQTLGATIFFIYLLVPIVPSSLSGHDTFQPRFARRVNPPDSGNRLTFADGGLAGKNYGAVERGAQNCVSSVSEAS